MFSPEGLFSNPERAAESVARPVLVSLGPDTVCEVVERMSNFGVLGAQGFLEE